MNLLYISTWLKEFPPFPNIMYAYVVHALRACHYKSKTDLYLYIYTNNYNICYNIFTVIKVFLLNSKLNSLSVMYIQTQNGTNYHKFFSCATSQLRKWIWQTGCSVITEKGVYYFFRKIIIRALHIQFLNLQTFINFGATCSF